MDFNTYQKLAARTINPDIPSHELVINGVMGCCGEAGEAIDIIKKHKFQGHPLDADKLKKELGDQLWYIGETCTGLGTTMEEIAQLNINKLRDRYPEGFTAEKSINRIEK